MRAVHFGGSGTLRHYGPPEPLVFAERSICSEDEALATPGSYVASLPSYHAPDHVNVSYRQLPLLTDSVCRPVSPKSALWTGAHAYVFDIYYSLIVF